MSPETKWFAIRKFIEGLVFSALVLVVFLYFFSWPAYFVLGGLVAVALAFREFKESQRAGYGTAYVLVAALNTILWPAMIYVNVTRVKAP